MDIEEEKMSKIILLENVNFIVPDKFTFPFTKFSQCPDCCGPGNGIAEKIIPETMWGLCISPACYVHDHSWSLAKPTWGGFHAANSMFLHNLMAIVQTRSKSTFLKHLRLYRCVTYFDAVDSDIGADIFWRMKS